MREQFRAHYPDSENELDHLWENATIVFDTNALLNLFRYSGNIRDDFLTLLEGVKSRLWIPHHVGAEFHRRRLSIPKQQHQSLEQFGKYVDQAKKVLKSSLNGFERHMKDEFKGLMKFIDSQLNELRDEVKAKFQDYKEDVLGARAHNETFQKITGLFDGRVGEPYGTERLIEIHNEGEQRYSLQIPPGYDDAGKSSNKYGDLIIWYQILEYVREAKRPVFFVTEDETEDWWTIVDAQPFAPRQEFVDEFLSHSSGRPIKFYTPQDFLKVAHQRGMGVKEETVQEVATFADEQRDAKQRKATQHRLFSRDSAGLPAVAGAIKQFRQGLDSYADLPAVSGAIEQFRRGLGSSAVLQNAVDTVSGRTGTDQPTNPSKPHISFRTSKRYRRCEYEHLARHGGGIGHLA